MLDRYCLKKEVVVTPTVLVMEVHFPFCFILNHNDWRITQRARPTLGRSGHAGRSDGPTKDSRKWGNGGSWRLNFYRDVTFTDSVAWILSLACAADPSFQMRSSRLDVSSSRPLYLFVCDAFVALLSLSTKGMWLLSNTVPLSFVAASWWGCPDTFPFDSIPILQPSISADTDINLLSVRYR